MVNRKQQSVAGRLLLIIALFSFVFLLLPLIIPVSGSEGVDPAEAASDASKFITIEGLKVHYVQAGSGADNVLLIHGDGGGTFSWKPVMGSLAEIGTVTAYDRTGWGLSERPNVDSSTVENPYDGAAHFRQFIGLVEELGLDEFIIIGQGEGANLAVRLARALPDKVTALVLESPVIEATDTSVLATFQPLLRSPQIRNLAPLYVRRQVDSLAFDLDAAYFRPSRITQEMREAYAIQTSAANWDVAMWENTVAPGLPDVSGELSAISAPVLVVAGAGDPIVSLTRSEAIANEIGAELATIAACGYLVHEECPDEFVAAVVPWLAANS